MIRGEELRFSGFGSNFYLYPGSAGAPQTRLTLTKRFTNLNLSQKNQAILCRDY